MEVLGIRSHFGIWREVTWISEGGLIVIMWDEFEKRDCRCCAVCAVRPQLMGAYDVMLKEPHGCLHNLFGVRKSRSVHT